MITILAERARIEVFRGRLALAGARLPVHALAGQVVGADGVIVVDAAREPDVRSAAEAAAVAELVAEILNEAGGCHD